MVDIKSITDNRDVLYGLAPFSEGVKALKRQCDLADFAYSDLYLYDSKLTKEGVAGILDGSAIPDAPVLEHRLCEAHRKLLNRFEDKIRMGLETDNALLDEFCMILTSEEKPPFRKGSPLLYHIEHIPGEAHCISKDLAEVFSAIRRAEKEGAYFGDFSYKAAAVHMGIIKIYPYIEGISELAARAAAQYELMRAGYFPVDLDVSEPEYNRICADALKSRDASEFAELLRKAVLKKLNMLIDAVKRGV